MKIKPPKIIQGGMGAGVSNWRLAQAVSRIGHLGVVSGTGLDEIMARCLQNGDPGGHIRRALQNFPFPTMAKRVLDKLFIPGGKNPSEPYKTLPMHSFEGQREAQELSIIGNYVEISLAREGHNNPVGINYLEKIHLPHLPAIYGALLAGVAVIIMGAGIPIAIPRVLAALTQHEKAIYPVSLPTEDGKRVTLEQIFDPADFIEGATLPPLELPDFLPIVSSESLASILLKKATGPIDGFIVEGNLAGGHNAPPRGKVVHNPSGEPIYGTRDEANLSKFREMGLPFWIAGSVGSAEGMQHALEEGASGIQVGTAFGLCTESGLLPEVRQTLIQEALDGKAEIITDPTASPTGFPFKVAKLANSLSDPEVYAKRKRICDLGFLREPYVRKDGKVGYRCPAEPIPNFIAKGGTQEGAEGRVCLCNALVANIGLPQILPDGTEEKCLITMGNDLMNVGRFCINNSTEFSAKDVADVLLGTRIV